MSATIHDGPVGAASAVKMIRSVMMKGLEALGCECVLAGRKAGVIETVLDSLDDTYPGFDWKKRSAYMLERVMTHGVRRASEMREVALTIDLLGLKGEMSRASVGWQQTSGELGLRANGTKAVTIVFSPTRFSRLWIPPPVKGDGHKPKALRFVSRDGLTSGF
jgi:3-hydroxyisobutyrate dehydrogenase-like beta-hydroxyacid dehydrogenase